MSSRYLKLGSAYKLPKICRQDSWVLPHAEVGLHKALDHVRPRALRWLPVDPVPVPQQVQRTQGSSVSHIKSQTLRRRETQTSYAILLVSHRQTSIFSTHLSPSQTTGPPHSTTIWTNSSLPSASLGSSKNRYSTSSHDTSRRNG